MDDNNIRRESGRGLCTQSSNSADTPKRPRSGSASPEGRPSSLARKEALDDKLAKAKAKYDTIKAVMDGAEEAPPGIDRTRFQAYSTLNDEKKAETFVSVENEVDAIERMRCALPEPLKDPIQLLASADYSCAPEAWLLSYPLVGPGGQVAETINLESMQKEFCAAEKRALDSLKISDPKGGVLLGIQAGMGIGKSHAIDIIDKLLFVGKNPIVLKVSYNFNQALRTEAERCEEGFLARLIFAFHRRVPPNSYALVKEALAPNMDRNQLTPKAVVRWLRAQTGAASRPVIIAVDELGALAVDGVMVCKAVLVMMGEVIREITEQSNGEQSAIGLVTALPNFELGTLSSRPPVIVKPVALSVDESMAFLKQCCAEHPPKDIELHEMMIMCCGHPRSLAVAAKLYLENNPPTVPPPSEISFQCLWKTTQGALADEIVAGLKEAYYRFGDTTLHEKPALKVLDEKAMLMKKGNRYAIPSTVFYVEVENKFKLRHIHEMLVCRTADVPTKALEHVNLHWDYFKRENDLPMIPPSVNSDGCGDYFYSFDPKVEPLGGSILKEHSGAGIVDSLKCVDSRHYYYPTASNHRAFEAMCVGHCWQSDGTKKEVLCLFQSKVNDSDVETAVSGLKTAASELSKIWHSDFLFIIFALSCSSETAEESISEAKPYRTIVVNRDAIDAYFTASLAVAAELCEFHHRQGL